jgi:pyrrolidone-carboxylate peptidase
VGNYVCGLVYYTTLAEMAKRGEGRRNAVFLQVPPLSGDMELAKGRDVLLSLILALVEVAQ